MAYHSLSESSLTDDERRAEADKITSILSSSIDQMNRNESNFVEKISDPRAPVSPKQIFWLRDLLEKYK